MAKIPEALSRELSAVALAEEAWRRNRDDVVRREALLRVSYYLSPELGERSWPAPSQDDFAIALEVLERCMNGTVIRSGAEQFVADALRLGSQLIRAGGG